MMLAASAIGALADHRRVQHRADPHDVRGRPGPPFGDGRQGVRGHGGHDRASARSSRAPRSALTQAILSGSTPGVSIGYPGALRVVVASALLAPLCALIGMALGAVIRHSAAAIISSVLILLMLPIVFTDSRHWAAVIDHALPFSAWMRLVDTLYDPNGGAYAHAPSHPWTITGAWTVYTLWALAAATLTVISVHRRDQ